MFCWPGSSIEVPADAQGGASGGIVDVEETEEVRSEEDDGNLSQQVAKLNRTMLRMVNDQKDLTAVVGLLLREREREEREKEEEKREKKKKEKEEETRRERDRLTLAAALKRKSGGRIGMELDDSADDSDRTDRYSVGDVVELASRLAEDVDVNEIPRLSKSARRFWREREKIPFPAQSLRYDSREGPGMLQRALTNHPTVMAHVESRSWGKGRNVKEAKTDARTIGCLIDEFKGLQGAGDPGPAIGYVYSGGATNSWEEADELCSESTDLMDARLMRRIRKSTKLAREAKKAPTKKPAGKEAGGNQ